MDLRTFVALPTASASLTVDEVLARLAGRSEVAAVLSLGSTASGMHDASDIDLLVVLNEGPAFTVEFSVVDQRPADIVFTNIETLRELTDTSDRLHGRLGDLARWLTGGRVELCRSAMIDRAISAVQALDPPRPDDDERFFRWVEINVNLVKLRRYRRAARSDYSDALELMLDHAFADLPRDMLVLHGVCWIGERDAVEWLVTNHPETLDVLQQGRAEPDLHKRLDLYERAAAAAVQVAGGLWPDGQTAGGWTLTDGHPASRFDRLVGDRASP